MWQCAYARVRVLKHIYNLLWYEFSLHESEYLIQSFSRFSKEIHVTECKTGK